MKKLLLSFLIMTVCFSQVNAQAPQKINYQGVARNLSGAPIANQLIGVKINIHDGTPTGTIVYTETHSVTTNAFGLFNLAIGGGTVVTGTMAGINWATGDKFVAVEMDPAGGTAYVAMGTSQLLSVPYALRSEDAGRIMMYGGGTQNGNKMIIQHSPGYPTSWGLLYNDTTDQFRFLNSGVMVSGPLKVTSGTPAVGEVLTSDAAGNATWEDMSTKVSAFQPAGCQSLAAVTATYQKVGDMGTFTKVSASSIIELTVQTNISIGSLTAGTNAAVFELRVDDVATTLGNATALIKTAGTFDPVIITGAFTGLTAGTHTVSLWAKVTNSGTGTNAMWDSGCYNSVGTNNVLVKEFK